MHNVKLNKDKQKLYDTLDALESEALIFGRRFINDSRVRARYKIATRKAANEILYNVDSGRINVQEGAKQANQMRNMIMQTMRLKSSDVSRAIAISYKKKGLTLPDLEKKYANDKFKDEFHNLPEEQKRSVWKLIIEKSMTTSPRFNKTVTIMSHSGRAFFILTATIAVYKVVKARNKVHEAAKQGLILSSAYAGGEIGGTVGAFGGPFDIVTVPLGVFIGGIVGAFATRQIDKV